MVILLSVFQCPKCSAFLIANFHSLIITQQSVIMQPLTKQPSIQLSENHSSLNSQQSALLDISNPNENNLQTSKKKLECKTSKKNIRTANKENIKEIDDSALRMIGYGSMSRSLQEKNQVIKQQRGEIILLKQCLSDIENNQQIHLSQEQRERQIQMKQLRQLEADYAWNLAQFEGMRKNMEQIRDKYETVLREKTAVTKKYDALLAENEELTKIIDSLKRDSAPPSTGPSNLVLKEEIEWMKEQLQLMESQKEQWEQGYDKIRKENGELLLRCELAEKSGCEVRGEKEKMQIEINDLQAKMERVQELLQEKESEQKSIAEKIQSLQRQIQEGSNFLHSQNDTLHSENSTLSNLISLQQQKISELTISNSDLTKELEMVNKNILVIQEEEANWEKEKKKLEEELRKVLDVEGKEKQYYRSKYEGQLEEYNSLSTQFRELEVQNSRLLKTNAANTVEIGNLKAELLTLKRQVDQLLKDDTRSCSSLNSHAVNQASFEVEMYQVLNSELSNELIRVKDQMDETSTLLKAERERCQKVWDENEQLKEMIRTKEINETPFKCCSEKDIQEKVMAMMEIKMELQKQIQDLKLLNSSIAQTHNQCLQLASRHSAMTVSWSKLKPRVKGLVESGVLAENERRAVEAMGEHIELRDVIIEELGGGQNHLFSLLMEGQSILH